MLKNLFHNRRYLIGSFWAEFRFRHAGTTLGLFWFVVNPLLEVLIYSVIFTYLLGFRSEDRGEVPYTLFLLIGLFPWLAFSQLITQGSNSLNSGALYLRRVPVPSEIFIAKDALVSMLSLCIYMIVLLPIVPFFKNSLSWSLLALPLLVLLITALGFGMILSLAHLRVFFPDIGEILRVLVQLWRWTLPINYSLNIFPGWLRSILIFNPPYFFITSFRTIFLDKKLPPMEAWLHMISWVLLFGIMGTFVTKRLGHEVKDQL